MFFRQRIQATCYNPAVHPFPVAMRFGGRLLRYGRPFYVMYCPICGKQEHFEYYGYRGTRIRRVA